MKLQSCFIGLKPFLIGIGDQSTFEVDFKISVHFRTALEQCILRYSDKVKLSDSQTLGFII